MLEFTEKLGIYAVATQMGKGVLPDPNPNPNPNPNPDPNPNPKDLKPAFSSLWPKLCPLRVKAGRYEA